MNKPYEIIEEEIALEDSTDLSNLLIIKTESQTFIFTFAFGKLTGFTHAEDSSIKH